MIVIIIPTKISEFAALVISSKYDPKNPNIALKPFLQVSSIAYICVNSFSVVKLLRYLLVNTSYTPFAKLINIKHIVTIVTAIAYEILNIPTIPATSIDTVSIINKKLKDLFLNFLCIFSCCLDPIADATPAIAAIVVINSGGT